MLVVKGILLGFALFAVGSIVYLVWEVGPIEEHKATALSAIAAWTVFNPWYWGCIPRSAPYWVRPGKTVAEKT